MLLWIGGGLCYVSVLIQYLDTNIVDYDNLILGGVLAIVCILTGSFMYYQERKSAAVKPLLRPLLQFSFTLCVRLWTLFPTWYLKKPTLSEAEL